MRRAAKVDANQSAIVAALQRLGCSVLHLHSLGNGAPDILVGWKGRNTLLEIKDGDKVPSARKLTEDERRFHALWFGQVAIVESVDDAIRVMTA